MKKILTLAVLVAALWFGVSSTASAKGHNCYDGCYVVMYGDTLYSIGRHYDVHPDALAFVNGLHNPNHIYAGQVLYIPKDAPGYPWGYCEYDCGHNKMGWGKKPMPMKYDKMGHKPMPMKKDKMGWDKPMPMKKHGKMDKKPSHCGDKCGGYYGYDYSGYYYGSYYPHKQYSYTCGYYSNCY